MRWIDLTQALKPGIPDWNGCCGFQLSQQNCGGVHVQELKTPAGIGTHMDAPAHFFKDSTDIASIDINHCICQAVVIDVCDKVRPDYFLSAADVKTFEKRYGLIPAGSVVLLSTGWSQYWVSPERYLNMDDNGRRIFPGFSLEAAEYLLEKDICGIGMDTLSPDGSHQGFPVHKAILGAGKYILENLCNLEQLPPVGSQIVALPLKIAGGTEAPARVIACKE